MDDRATGGDDGDGEAEAESMIEGGAGGNGAGAIAGGGGARSNGHHNSDAGDDVGSCLPTKLLSVRGCITLAAVALVFVAFSAIVYRYSSDPAVSLSPSNGDAAHLQPWDQPVQRVTVPVEVDRPPPPPPPPMFGGIPRGYAGTGQRLSTEAELDAVKASLFDALNAALTEGPALAKPDAARIGSYTPVAAAALAGSGKIAYWSIITTIHHSTPAVHKLASNWLPTAAPNARGGWCTVVVADSKTPKDWWEEYEANPRFNATRDCLVYLGVDHQNALPYSVVALTPWRSYARKNVGYLFAIAHGAESMYESDDDNELLTSEPVVLPHTIDSMLTFNNSAERLPLLNPYAYFGHSDIWPRGYPLEAIGDAMMEGSSSMTPPALVCEQRPWIQQGLANGDPDVDAVFRLTRKVSGSPIRVAFQDKPPVAIPAGTFVPFNAQNTFWLYGAFWGLNIPISVNFRVTDIWRSYFAQRMLWEIESGPVLSFLPASVFQDRNAHNYLADYRDEAPIYDDVGRFIEFMLSTAGAAPLPDERTFFHRVLRMSYDLAENGFWTAKDVVYTREWLIDLVKFGYQVPALYPKAPAHRFGPHPPCKDSKPAEPEQLCAKPCMNGGSCVAKNTCECPSPLVRGSRCEFDCRLDDDDPLRDLGPMIYAKSGPLRVNDPVPYAVRMGCPAGSFPDPPALTWPIDASWNNTDRAYPIDRQMNSNPGGSYEHPRKDPVLTRAARWRDLMRRSLLIVHFNWPGFDDSFQTLHKPMYQHAFPNMIAVGTFKPDHGINATSGLPNNNEDWVFCETTRGCEMYFCIGEVLRQKPGYDAYFMINNDVQFAYWRIPQHNLWMSHVWSSSADRVDNPGGIDAAVNSAPAYYRNMLLTNDGAAHWLHMNSDSYYIPARLVPDFITMTSHFYRTPHESHPYHMEAATPASMKSIATSDQIDTMQLQIAGWAPPPAPVTQYGVGEQYQAILPDGSGLVFVHSVKMIGNQGILDRCWQFQRDGRVIWENYFKPGAVAPPAFSN